MNEKHAYDVAETAKALSVSVGTVNKLLNTTDPKDFLPSARVGTKRLIRPTDIEAWLDRHMEN